MTHRRNVEGLRQSARTRHAETRRRATEALCKLDQNGQAISFTSVAQTAAVSVSWLYKQPDIKQRIIYLREQQRQEGPAPVSRKSTDTATEAIIAALKQRIEDLTMQNRQLQQQLEVVYGQLRQRQRETAPECADNQHPVHNPEIEAAS